MTSLEVTHFILALKTDHRVSRTDLFLVYLNNEIKTPKNCKFDAL